MGDGVDAADSRRGASLDAISSSPIGSLRDSAHDRPAFVCPRDARSALALGKWP